MKNENLCSPTLKAGGRASASIRLRNRNTLCRDHDQASLLRAQHYATFVLWEGKML